MATEPSVVRPLLVEMDISIKTYDIDFMHIVHNIVYLRWLEDLRLRLMELHHPLDEMLEARQSPVLTRTEIDYRQPVRFGDEVRGRLWLSNLTRIRWTVAGEILVGDQLAVTARQMGFIADMDTLRPVPIPPSLRDRWQSARAAGA